MTFGVELGQKILLVEETLDLDSISECQKLIDNIKEVGAEVVGVFAPISQPGLQINLSVPVATIV